MTGGDGSEVAIELRGVHKAFRGHPVLRGVDLAIREGETFTILGGSGSGKSVCLKHMIGLLKPDAGRVCAFGEDISELGEEALIDVRKRLSMSSELALFVRSPSTRTWLPAARHRAGERADRRARCEAAWAVGLPGSGRAARRAVGRRTQACGRGAQSRSSRVVLYTSRRPASVSEWHHPIER
jgi:phospholipid/cholesterol/gamma-HCH transport system ATP-binding protein